MELKGGWVLGSVDTTVINQHKWTIKFLSNDYIKIYENTGRLDEALNLYLNNKKDLITHACLNCYIEDLGLYYNKSFNLSYKLNKLDTAFNIYLAHIFVMATIEDVDAIEDVIGQKIFKYNKHQKDSILKAAFDSFKIVISQNKEFNSFRTNFEIFGKRIPNLKEIGPRPILDSNISITDTTYMINYDWDRFKRTRLYELLAERK